MPGRNDAALLLVGSCQAGSAGKFRRVVRRAPIFQNLSKIRSDRRQQRAPIAIDAPERRRSWTRALGARLVEIRVDRPSRAIVLPAKSIPKSGRQSEQIS